MKNKEHEMTATPRSPHRHGPRRAPMALAFMLGLGAMNAPAVHAQQDTNAQDASRARNGEPADGLAARPGEATRDLLEWQRSGRGASTHRQTLSGPVQSAIWTRYVDSFRQPIPKTYIDTDDYGSP